MAVALLGLLIPTMGLGCTLLPAAPTMDSALEAGTVPAAPLASGAPAPTFAVIIQAADGRTARYVRSLQEPTTVEMVVEQSRALERFQRVDLELYRPMPSGHHRMEIEFDRENHRVEPLYDYTVYPGDQLVITENTETVLDEMLGSLSILKTRKRR